MKAVCSQACAAYHWCWLYLYQGYWQYKKRCCTGSGNPCRHEITKNFFFVISCLQRLPLPVQQRFLLPSWSRWHPVQGCCAFPGRPLGVCSWCSWTDHQSSHLSNTLSCRAGLKFSRAAQHDHTLCQRVTAGLGHGHGTRLAILGRFTQLDPSAYISGTWRHQPNTLSFCSYRYNELRLSFGFCCLLLDARGRQTYQPANFSAFSYSSAGRKL